MTLCCAGPLRVLAIALMLVAVPWAVPGLGGAVAGTVALCSGDAFRPFQPRGFSLPSLRIDHNPVVSDLNWQWMHTIMQGFGLRLPPPAGCCGCTGVGGKPRDIP